MEKEPYNIVKGNSLGKRFIESLNAGYTIQLTGALNLLEKMDFTMFGENGKGIRKKLMLEVVDLTEEYCNRGNMSQDGINVINDKREIAREHIEEGRYSDALSEMLAIETFCLPSSETGNVLEILRKRNLTFNPHFYDGV